MRPTIDPKFRNKNGSLTVYAFACGYIETVEDAAGSRCQLYLDGVWHVRKLFRKIQRIAA